MRSKLFCTPDSCFYSKDVLKDANVQFDASASLGTDWAGINLGIALLLGQNPLVLSIETNGFFNSPLPGPGPTTGQVLYVPNQPVTGGHAVAVMGYVLNADLPPGAVPGASGGYFIIKNSWGSGWGDGGYVYLPFAYVMEYGMSLSTVSVL